VINKIPLDKIWFEIIKGQNNRTLDWAKVYKEGSQVLTVYDLLNEKGEVVPAGSCGTIIARKDPGYIDILFDTGYGKIQYSDIVRDNILSVLEDRTYVKAFLEEDKAILEKRHSQFYKQYEDKEEVSASPETQSVPETVNSVADSSLSDGALFDMTVGLLEEISNTIK
jgi:hypothetical protein